ncbi:MAG TPA: LysR family transcriptional regulator [Candidatus Dormibacteraeota bacterium]|jgi:DNA-binding transcriptional LysR family regulator|nr:LysR family transcriptional regulator [Candidatus Dormibacteraeota bacterium]
MPGVLLVQLEGFVAVASRGNVTRAARDLGISQPALTARVRTLERELGVALLARGSRGVRLTDEGRALLPYAERVVGAAGEAARAIARVRGGAAGVIDIGAAPSVGTYVLPGVLERFRTANPGVQINVRTGHSEEILDMVLRERVQVGVVRALRHPDIDAWPLYEDELALVVNLAHPFARRADVRIEDLGEQQLILFDRASSYHDLTSAFIREAGVRPRGVMELDNIDAAKKMVEHGLGVALLPRTAIADEITSGSMRTVAIRDSAPLRRQIVVIRRADAGAPSPTLASFLETLRAVTQSRSRQT